MTRRVEIALGAARLRRRRACGDAIVALEQRLEPGRGRPVAAPHRRLGAPEAQRTELGQPRVVREIGGGDGDPDGRPVFAGRLRDEGVDRQVHVGRRGREARRVGRPPARGRHHVIELEPRTPRSLSRAARAPRSAPALRPRARPRCPGRPRARPPQGRAGSRRARRRWPGRGRRSARSPSTTRPPSASASATRDAGSTRGIRRAIPGSSVTAPRARRRSTRSARLAARRWRSRSRARRRSRSSPGRVGRLGIARRVRSDVTSRSPFTSARTLPASARAVRPGTRRSTASSGRSAGRTTRRVTIAPRA